MSTANEQKSYTGAEILEGLTVNLKLSQELLSTLQEESVALRAMDTQGLFRLSRQKDTLLAKIHYLDDSLKRSQAITDTAPSAAGLTPEQSLIASQYTNSINSIRQEIQARNRVNKRFTEVTLGYISDAIALITRQPEADNTYHIPGRSQARGSCMPSYISRGV